MEVAFIGLGRMGANMVRRLSQGGHKVVAYNRTAEKTKEIMTEGAEGAFTLEELVHKLKHPRILWIMVPAGQPVDDQIAALEPMLAKGDILIDGGNSYYKDSIRRGQEVTAKVSIR